MTVLSPFTIPPTNHSVKAPVTFSGTHSASLPASSNAFYRTLQQDVYHKSTSTQALRFGTKLEDYPKFDDFLNEEVPDPENPDKMVPRVNTLKIWNEREKDVKGKWVHLRTSELSTKWQSHKDKILSSAEEIIHYNFSATSLALLASQNKYYMERRQQKAPIRGMEQRMAKPISAAEEARKIQETESMIGDWLAEQKKNPKFMALSAFRKHVAWLNQYPGMSISFDDFKKLLPPDMKDKPRKRSRSPEEIQNPNKR
jgi:hypothetical protein